MDDGIDIYQFKFEVGSLAILFTVLIRSLEKELPSFLEIYNPNIPLGNNHKCCIFSTFASCYGFLDSKHALVVESGASTSVLIDLYWHLRTEATSQVCQYASIRGTTPPEYCCQDKH